MSLIKLIKIKVSQDYGWKTMMQDSDIRRVRDRERFTIPSDYIPIWKEIEVTEEELLDYVKNGYSIKINC
jgi:hypothetical protein